MSYILDALKKSDQQRQQTKGPNLQTIHRPTLINSESPLLRLIVVLLLLLLISMALVFWWYFSSAAQVVKPINAVPELALPLKQPQTDETSAINLSAQDVVVSAATMPIGSTASPAKLTANEAVIRFNDLDAAQRSAIPGLTFSFHVYSDNPARRTIIINNRRVKEGELVDKDLLLEEITSLGVVMLWQNQLRFSIDVVESW